MMCRLHQKAIDRRQRQRSSLSPSLPPPTLILLVKPFAFIPTSRGFHGNAAPRECTERPKMTREGSADRTVNTAAWGKWRICHRTCTYPLLNLPNFSTHVRERIPQAKEGKGRNCGNPRVKTLEGRSCEAPRFLLSPILFGLSLPGVRETLLILRLVPPLSCQACLILYLLSVSL